MANKRQFLLIFIKQLSVCMASRLLVILVITAALMATVHGWCQKTHFAEISQINQIDFSPDRTMVVTSSNSRRMIVWNFTNLQPIFTHTFSGSVKSAKFSKNQNYIAVGQSSSQVSIFHVSNFSFAINITTTSSSVAEVDFSWDNSRLLVCGSNTIEVFWTANWTKEGNVSNGGTSFTACKFQKNNQYAGGDSSGKTNVYNSGSNNLLWSDSQSGSVLSLDFDMVNWTLISATGSNNKIYIYPSARWPTGGGTSQTLNKTTNIGNTVNSVAFSKDGSVYAVGVQSYLLIYENSTNKLLFNWTGTGSIISGVFSYDSQYYISGNSWGIAKVFKRSCQACPAGTFESSTGCPLCSSAMIGCFSCANSSYCFVCGDGYAIDSVNFNCTLCNNNIPGCVLCNSTGICTACSSLYYLASNSCTSCQTIPNCVTCNSSSSCIRCNADFYLDTSTYKCLPCQVNNCVNCYNASACISCASGYYLDSVNLNCTRCRQNCTDCYNATTCNQCVESYYLNSSSLCTSCPANCLACNFTICTRCIASYYTSGTGCMPCSGACYACNNSSYCYVCIPGYFQSSGTCIPCSGNCLTCTNATFCLTCNVNFYFSGATNTCNKCQSLLTGCLECTNTTCLRCQSGYYYDGTNCVKCSTGYGCQTCYNSTFCMSCLSGYVLNSATGVCSLCGIGCSSCSNSSVCINCLPKYYLSSGVCTLCQANCPTCLNATYCLACVQGFYVNSTQGCTNCNGSITNCASCSASNYCTSCQLGYSLSATNTSCVKCAWPCSLCNATQCNQCATGYYLASGACSICPSNCSSCFSSSLCTSCANGFYLTASNTCSSCLGLSAGCATCNQTTCLGCLTNLGYYLTSGMNCSLCTSISNCLMCKNNTFCTICSFGYYSNAGACSTCNSLISNCQLCNATACLNCMDPYYLSGSSCQLCAQGCSACSNSTTCKSCLTGYLLQTGSCTYCDTLINGCEVCTSTTVCTECAQGYIISGTSCSPCNSLMPGCQFCNGTSFCLTCMDQYYLNSSNNCAKCDSMTGCSQCNSSSVCLSCQSGYYKTTTNTCSQCADVMCITCTNSTNCINCLSGFYFNSSGNCRQCSSQITGCVLCNSTQCLQCQSGYYLNSTNQCSICQINGCEICNAASPTQCVTCSSLYYLNSNVCYSCGLSMTGCLNCISSTHCLKCMVGSYLAANFSCQSCFSLFKGCRECSATACTVCQGSYIMNGTSCATCIAFLPGCLYCTSTTVCLSCQSGYFAANNTCHSCGGITGCLDCSNVTSCNLCSDSYYLNSTDNLCYLCNSTLTGCISCSAVGTCKACLGNYGLSGGICTALKTISTMPYSQLRLVSQYIDKNYLKHRLIVKGSFNTQTAVNLTQSSTITMVGNNVSTVLTIYSYRWVGQFELVFITNNPLGSNFNSLYKSMPAARMLSEQQKPAHPRLLSSNINLNYQFQLDMTEPAIQSILPNSDHMGSLSMTNPATNPSFIRSVYTQMPYNYHYFGLVVTLLMLVIYFVKAAISVPQSDDQGELISHVFLLRCGGVIFSLAYMEYIDYCYGFLSPDLPWLNLLTSDLAASADLSPNSYLLFYSNMTIASTYLSALCLVVALILIIAAIAALSPQRREGLKVVGVFLYNFFEVGLIMAGSMSIQGAYYNNLNYFTSNSMFYIIGILLYVVVGVVNLWMAVSSIHRINKVRVMVKTTLLSLLYVSPVYLIPIALGVQAIFIIAEYSIKKAAKLHPHVWLTNQILVNVALLALVLLSKSLLSIFIPSILVVVALLMDLFIHIREYRHQQQLVKVKEIQKLTNLMETQEKLNRTIKKRNNTIYESTKMHETGMSSTVFSQDLVFNNLDEDISSSKSPFHSKPKKENALYIFDDSQEF